MYIKNRGWWVQTMSYIQSHALPHKLPCHMVFIPAEGGDRQMLTLRDAIHEMGDSGKKISYLKVDLEGAELNSISNWIIDGLPKNIDQVGPTVGSF